MERGIHRSCRYEGREGGREGGRERGREGGVLVRLTRPLAGEEAKKRCVTWLVEEGHLLRLARSKVAAAVVAVVAMVMIRCNDDVTQGSFWVGGSLWLCARPCANV